MCWLFTISVPKPVKATKVFQDGSKMIAWSDRDLFRERQQITMT